MTLFAAVFFLIALFIAMTIIVTQEKKETEKKCDKSLRK